MSVGLVPNDYWDVPAYAPYVQPPLTEQLVREAEAKLGVKLPSTYLAALRVQNGGYVRRTFPEIPHRCMSGIGPHFPNILDQTWRESNPEDETSQLPDSVEKLVAVDGDGHWFLCFDYRKRGPHHEPAVSYVDVECGSESELAPSFDDFVASMKMESVFSVYGVLDAQPIKKEVKRLSAVLGAKLKYDRGNADGIPSWKTKIGDPEDYLWVTAHANDVPKTWARRGERGYDQLKKLPPATVLSWPEFPDCAVLVSVTPEAMEQFEGACLAGGVALKLLLDMR